MVGTNLTKLFTKRHFGKWVAIADNKKVVGVGKHPKIALSQAIKRGYKNPSLMVASGNYANIYP